MLRVSPPAPPTHRSKSSSPQTNRRTMCCKFAPATFASNRTVMDRYRGRHTDRRSREIGRVVVGKMRLRNPARATPFFLTVKRYITRRANLREQLIATRGSAVPATRLRHHGGLRGVSPPDVATAAGLPSSEQFPSTWASIQALTLRHNATRLHLTCCHLA